MTDIFAERSELSREMRLVVEIDGKGVSFADFWAEISKSSAATRCG
jgi:hypothetical protein